MIFRYLRQYFKRRLLFRIYRWHFSSVLIILFFFIFFLQLSLFVIIYSIFIYHSNQCCSRSSEVIISLTSTPERFHYELPFAVHSLLSQTQLPKQIRVYLSPTSAIIRQQNLTLSHLKIYLQNLDSSTTIASLFDRLVQIRLEGEDYGPATKFLPIIKEFHSKKNNKSQSQLIMICDDDHYYHPYTLVTLDKYANKYHNSIVGLRGWRSKNLFSDYDFVFSSSVRQDLVWGVRGSSEITHHVIQSHRLSQIYRVGIITANFAYIIRPSFFDSQLYLDFNQVPNDIRHVDDIWLNGQASKRNISRYVVPSCCSHIGVTQTHALEEYLSRNKITRSVANNHALQWFNQSWEKDLWYKFNGKNGPIYRDWWMTISREWISIIEWLKFVNHFGFVYV